MIKKNNKPQAITITSEQPIKLGRWIPIQNWVEDGKI
jgi:hypothetical protein